MSLSPIVTDIATPILYLKEGSNIGINISLFILILSWLNLSLPKHKNGGVLNTWTYSPVMNSRKSINTYIFIVQLQQRKGHDFESQPHINCVPLSKSLKPIKTHFIPLNNNAQKSTSYTRKHYAPLFCPRHCTQKTKKQIKWEQGEKIPNSF